MEAEFIIELGEKSSVPIISFTATSSSLSSIRSPYFIRSTVNDSSQVNAICSIVKKFGWRQVVPVYTDNEFGEGIVPFLSDALDAINTRVPYRSAIPETATDDEIAAELYKLMTMQTRVFVVHMVPSFGSRFFKKVKQIGMMNEGYVWIITDAMANALSSLDSNVIDSMQGVIGVRPYVPQTIDVVNFTNRWTVKFSQDNPGVVHPQLNVFGLLAYDSATALAMAVEKSGAMKRSKFQKPNISANSTDLATFGTSPNGPDLLQALLNTSFIGLSGEFQFVDGQLQFPPYQIVNVIGSGFREIGFWTATDGILRQLDRTNLVGKSELGAIIWPGDTTSLPKGWQIPTNGKKLRIGVPIKLGFKEFVDVKIDPSTNTTEFTGYCIDVFKAVVASLPYALSYEFVPFKLLNGRRDNYTYDDLVYQVFLGNFDAAVGDVTIIANRSIYVDFTLPYTESGVKMIVPIERIPDSKAWLFVKPLKWKMWLASFSAFVVIGMLIWFLEHRINEDFRGPLTYQVGMVFWFAFSTMVFAHKEKIISNLARFVLIIWFLVVLILTQAYTASLTSMLTVQQLRPTVTDVNQLIKNRDFVGYSQVSFVFAQLKRMGFEESRLVKFNSADELDHLFSKGKGNGQISAAFHENPYIDSMLAKYCHKYTTVQPTYKTGGFGFVFPIGSPLVPDISRAILNVSQGEKMVLIENAWSLGKSQCIETLTSISSVSLDIDSFWGLFLIVGVAVFFAFFIYLGRFLHEHWHIVTNHNYTVTGKIKILARRFDNIDKKSYTFRDRGLRSPAPADDIQDYKDPVNTPPGERRGDEPQAAVTLSPLPASQDNNAPSSPSVSDQTEHDINSLPGEQGAASQEITPVHE